MQRSIERLPPLHIVREKILLVIADKKVCANTQGENMFSFLSKPESGILAASTEVSLFQSGTYPVPQFLALPAAFIAATDALSPVIFVRRLADGVLSSAPRFWRVAVDFLRIHLPALC